MVSNEEEIGSDPDKKSRVNEDCNLNDKDELWKKIGRPRFIVAPMVDASELPWRLLSRQHGAHLCYTPMYHASVFCRDSKYRKEALATTPEDRPLIVQFCGNDPAILLQAAQLAEEFCDAIDINIGCPQAIAKRGHYGAFLQDDWELLTNIVRTLRNGLKIPVTCKLRVYPEIEKTVEYAKMLEAAGASLLTVHGRTRDQRGPLTGLASWKHIKAVREAINVPLFGNGNIQCIQDVEKCIEYTGVQGVMTAEGNLYNPYIFEGSYPPGWEPATEYLDLVEKYPVPGSYVRGHLFKIFQHILCLEENAEERSCLASNSTMDAFRKVVENIKKRYLPYHEGKLVWKSGNEDYNLQLPPWLCQPYVRKSPEEHISKIEARKIELEENGVKREYLDEQGNQVTRKRMKKLRRISKKPNRSVPSENKTNSLCPNCPNPLGTKCDYGVCRQCCRNRCYSENLDCMGHRNHTKTRRKMAKDFAAQRSMLQTIT